ncbi:glycerol kinase [candidate division BRC1 bacterium HGW-BRC1-1]|nr:MAG: glycerol kinase [candidate division BRC1 bacterium HGW-BRC1-1]
MSKYILALDQGTTSSRAILFDRAAHPLAMAQKEITQIFPQPGWVEHDPREIWSSQIGVVAEVLSHAAISPKDVATIGITNQRETVILWDRESGDPVSNAIVWQDRRTAEAMEKLKQDGLEPLLREKTGLVADAYFSASKIQWLLDNVPGARNRASAGKLAFGTVDSWLLYKLTGGQTHATDVSNASRTLLYNIHTCDWDEELLNLFNIPREILPEGRPSSGLFAETSSDIGFAGIPVAGIAGDQQSALFGQLCTKPGLMKNTYGTGCFLLMNTGQQPAVSTNGLLSTIGYMRDGVVDYALEGSVFIGGAVVQWLRDGLQLIRTASEVEALAATVKDNGGVYLVPAFSGLGAPHWNQYARGTIVGITRGTTAGHFARAALEAIAFQVADLAQAMNADTRINMTELRVDGGAAANNVLMQLQADILQVPIVRPRNLETTALGAAFLAGLAVGFWKDLDELANLWEKDRSFEPQMPEAQAAELRANWSRAVQRSCDWETD